MKTLDYRSRAVAFLRSSSDARCSSFEDLAKAESMLEKHRTVHGEQAFGEIEQSYLSFNL